MSWCEYKGFRCKDKDCSYPHHKKPIEGCDAMLCFDDSPAHVFCEKFKNHDGTHKALMFEWEDGINGEVVADKIYWFQGLNMIKFALTSKGGEK